MERCDSNLMSYLEAVEKTLDVSIGSPSIRSGSTGLLSGEEGMGPLAPAPIPLAEALVTLCIVLRCLALSPLNLKDIPQRLQEKGRLLPTC